MKKQSQDLTNEQLHIEDAAAVQEEYSLEDIIQNLCLRNNAEKS